MGALENREDAEPTARVYFLGDGSPHPGWYLQWYVGVRLVTLRLPLISDADAFDAGTKARADPHRRTTLELLSTSDA